MIIYPAIDIKDGKCVRLKQGDFNEVTVFGENPIDMAVKWESEGAEFLHVVDLDGARKGEPINLDIIVEISQKLNIPVQSGGGIRTMSSIDSALARGLRRVILGTSAVKNKEFVKTALEIYKDKIVIGIDAKDGMVAIEGWEETSNINAISFAKQMVELGAKTIIYTDISRDGMLTGPNLHAMEEMSKAVNAEIIASGGVGCEKDIENLKKTGVAGVIVGKALYTGDVSLKRLTNTN
jgi:phosphoribosylformimino-5-aminoimidazole carboxamide ribotide isomerase